MTLADQIDADVADVFLNTNEHAESVTHRPLGNASNDASVAALIWMDEPEIQNTNGRATVQRGYLDVSSTLSLNESDRWEIRGRWYDTETVSTPDTGMVRVAVVERRADTVTSAGRTSRR